jgi:hypothetical protein
MIFQCIKEVFMGMLMREELGESEFSKQFHKPYESTIQLCSFLANHDIALDEGLKILDMGGGGTCSSLLFAEVSKSIFRSF